MLIATSVGHVVIDRQRFEAFCRYVGGPDITPPQLVAVSGRHRNTFGSVLGFYDPDHNVIAFNEHELSCTLEQVRKSVRDIVTMLLMHEMGHFLCVRAPHISLWARVHNASHHALGWCTTRLFDTLPTYGPGAAPWVLLSFFWRMREEAADRIGVPLYRKHRYELRAMIHVY